MQKVAGKRRCIFASSIDVLSLPSPLLSVSSSLCNPCSVVRRDFGGRPEAGDWPGVERGVSSAGASATGDGVRVAELLADSSEREASACNIFAVVSAFNRLREFLNPYLRAHINRTGAPASLDNLYPLSSMPMPTEPLPPKPD